MNDLQTITAGWETLLRQAPMTAATYLDEAVRCIDARFGEGYSAKHPELVAAFMQVCAQDFGAASLKIGMQEVAEALNEGAKLVALGVWR